MRNIKDIEFNKWGEILGPLGLKPYVSNQIYQWLFKKGVTSFDEMTNLSKEVRNLLSKKFFVSRLKTLDILTDEDRTMKFLFELSDGERIESVFIPAEAGRYTICISSEVGCALGCLFCRTGSLAFVRNLTPSEIIDQILEVRRYIEDKGGEITNIVFMGMGEPLNNYEHVRQAITIMKDEEGFAFAKRRITLSTAGIVPGILRMVGDELGVKLAVSLNATTDEVRQRIMPGAKKYKIHEVIEACRKYNPPGSRYRTTFEYVLIDGINDTMDDARRLVALMSKLPSKINLIPFNPFPGASYKKPKGIVLKEFYNYLYNKHIQVNIRQSRGENILAACGQLAGKEST